MSARTTEAEYRAMPGTLTTYPDLVQGSDEWLEARRGVLTASVIGELLTPTLALAKNDSARGLLQTLVAERITGWIEPVYQSQDMFRGRMDEPLARDLYSKTYAPATELGFMVREGDGFRLGYSPDGLVGDDGLIEVKSAKPKIHLRRILADQAPAEHMAQMQAGMVVSGRRWCDFISYCGGMPMWVKRVYRDDAWVDAILAAATVFETTAALTVEQYNNAVKGLPLTERIEYFPEATL